MSHKKFKRATKIERAKLNQIKQPRHLVVAADVFTFGQGSRQLLLTKRQHRNQTSLKRFLASLSRGRQ